MPAPDDDWMRAPLPSGRHGLPRDLVVRSQRQRLLSAAIEIAGADGYGGMTVSAVIARAGVSRKTFYEQFADREHCFLAAYDEVAERGLRGLRAAFAAEAPWADRLRDAFAWGLDALAAHPAQARVAFVEVLAAGPQALAHRDRALRELTGLIAPGFDAAPRDAAVPASMPDAVAGAICELIGARVRAGRAQDLPALLPDLVYCALAPFAGPRAAASAAAPRSAGRRVRA